MGNRAVITVGDKHGFYNPNGIGVYLHWNGADRTLSCRDCKGVPYMDAYGEKPEDNPNNYLWSDSKTQYRKVKPEAE